MLQTFPDYNEYISINDVSRLATCCSCNDVTTNDLESVFLSLDLNNDGFITLHQCYNLITKTPGLWTDFISFRKLFINTLFPHNHFVNVLKRKLNYRKIREYRDNHKGKFPSENCVVRFKNGFADYLPVNRYDFSNEGEIQFQLLIHLYITNFRKKVNLIQEALTAKYLNSFKKYDIIGFIDSFYILYTRSLAITVTSQEAHSITSPSSKTSILRPSTRNRYRMKGKLLDDRFDISLNKNNSASRLISIHSENFVINIESENTGSSIEEKVSA